MPTLQIPGMLSPMEPLRMTTRATAQWLADLILEYAQDYDTAYQSFVNGQQLTTEDQSRWTVQMIFHHLHTADEARFRDTNTPSQPRTREMEIAYLFHHTMRDQGYDDDVISHMITSRMLVTMDFPHVLRSPDAHYALAPFVKASSQNPSFNVQESISYGIKVALLALPRYRHTIHRTMETLWALAADDSRLRDTERQGVKGSIDTMQFYANLLLVAMTQHTNTRIAYRDDVPYDWQYPMFLQTLDTVVDEHHDTIQQVLYTAGMSVRRGSRKAYRHILSDGLRTVASLEQSMRQ